MNSVVKVTTEDLNDIVSRVVTKALAQYGFNESHCNTEDLKRAIADRTDYECQGIPVRAVFDYYQRIYGGNLESQNDFFAKNLIEAMMVDKVQHFSSDYDSNLNIVIQLLAIPEKDENRSVECWKRPLIALGNKLNMTVHWNGFFYYEKGIQHTTENQLAKGNFNRMMFYDENQPHKVPHIILLTNMVSRENFGKIVEVKKGLEDIGCELLCVLALGKLAQM